jgi:hypothetical protein
VDRVLKVFDGLMMGGAAIASRPDRRQHRHARDRRGAFALQA